jgi:hypothetical protein
VSFLLNYFVHEFIQTDALFNKYLEEKYDGQFDQYGEFSSDLDELEFLEEEEGISWEDILFDFFYTLARCAVTIPLLAMVFSSGYFLTNSLYKVKYSVVCKAVLVSSFVFLLEICLKAAYFKWIKTDHSFNDFLTFKPVHLVAFFDRSQLAEWAVPFLEFVNLYEIVFLFSISYFIAHFYRKDFAKVLVITSVTDLAAFSIWRLFMIYILKIF